MNFTSTKSMEKSDANPDPYNEFEMLIQFAGIVALFGDGLESVVEDAV